MVKRVDYSDSKDLTRHKQDDDESAHHVTVHVMLITDDKDHVKSRQDRWHEVNVLSTLSVVPTAIDAVSSSQH